MLDLDGKQPNILGLKDIISKYIDYQKEVIYRRTRFDCDKAEKRVHILEGYKIALDHIDEIIKIIKAAQTDDEAKEKLIKTFDLDAIQVDAILEMKLRRLTGLEKTKIEEELKELLELIEKLKLILSSDEKVYEVL